MCSCVCLCVQTTIYCIWFYALIYGTDKEKEIIAFTYTCLFCIIIKF